MLFKETLDRLRPEVEAALDEIFSAAKANQTHEHDLLLIEVNGFYEKRYEDTAIGYSPFLIGSGDWSYEADHTQYQFFDFYRRTIINIPRVEYLRDYETSKEKQDIYNLTLQMELMVYLKFWESDRMLKKLYQLSNLTIGKSYEWPFEITKDDKRHILIRELIRDRIKDVCPKYFQLLKGIYLSQIRNAVAHSDYYILPNTLGFNNVDQANHAPLGQIRFDVWEERFHKLILFYNGLIGRFNHHHKEYKKQQADKHYGLEVRMTRSDGTEKKKFIRFVTDPRPRWEWHKEKR